jgi:hypothetical protein
MAEWFYDNVFEPILSCPTFDMNPIRLASSFVGWLRSYLVETPSVPAPGAPIP